MSNGMHLDLGSDFQPLIFLWLFGNGMQPLAWVCGDRDVFGSLSRKGHALSGVACQLSLQKFSRNTICLKESLA